jgi:hypothetical protein
MGIGNVALNNKLLQRMQRTESLKNEHVIFADEFVDEKFSPHPATEAAVSGILQNKEEVPVVDPDGADKITNTFEDIQPLDDLQLIRRKSLQLSPSGSRSSSKHGSRTDLSNLDTQDENLEITEYHHRSVLKFADESIEPGSGGPEPVLATEIKVEGDLEDLEDVEPVMDVKKILKILRKIEMSDEEIRSVIDAMIKKEEQVRL